MLKAWNQVSNSEWTPQSPSPFLCDISFPLSSYPYSSLSKLSSVFQANPRLNNLGPTAHLG